VRLPAMLLLARFFVSVVAALSTAMLCTLKPHECSPQYNQNTCRY
jgi:hypothetical protein